MAEQEFDKILYKTAPSRIIFVHWYVLAALLAGTSAAITLQLLQLDLPEFLGTDLAQVLSLAAAILAFFLFLYAELKRITRRYYVMEHRVARREGILSKRMQYMPYVKIERVEMNQSILKRIFGIGDVSVDTGEDTIMMEAVRNPSRIERLVAEQLMEETQTRELP